MLVLILLVHLGLCDLDLDFIGKGVYLPGNSFLAPSPNVQVLANVQEKIQKTKLEKSLYEFKMFENEVSFYTYASLQTNVGIKFSYDGFTFGARYVQFLDRDLQQHSLEDVYSSATYYDYKVKGISQHYIHEYADYILKQVDFKIDDAILAELEKLPKEVSNPHLSSSWSEFDNYLRKFGSHVVVGGVEGSRLETFSMASSSVNYTDKQFMIKSCLDLEGPLPLDFSASICSQYTKEERSSVKNLKVSSTVKAYGGSAKTRSELMFNRTAELIVWFLEEYNQSTTPIIFYYKPIWEILYALYPYKSNEWYIGRNLEAFYQGFKAFGCSYQKNSVLELRKFKLEDGRYVCVRPQDGCQANEDCDWWLWGSQCGCVGNGCIASDSAKSVRYGQDYAHARTKHEESHDTGINKSCQYEVGVYCGCTNKYKGEMCTLFDQNLEPYTPDPSKNGCHPFGEPAK